MLTLFPISLQLANDGLKTANMQHFYDTAKYNTEERDGDTAVRAVKAKLQDYFMIKEEAAKVNFMMCLLKK